MTVNPKYLIYHDLIGLKASVRPKTKSNKDIFSDIGTIIDESKNMLISKKDDNIKKYIKKDYMFKFPLLNSKENEKGLYLEVNGDKIVGRPENRLRSLKKKKRLKK